MLITKRVKIKWNKNNKNSYVSKGYIFTKYKDEFEVNVNDLNKGSKEIIQVLCDYCLENNKETIVNKRYDHYVTCNLNGMIG
jgi:uncharacterized protein involved in tellurium resistance